MNELLAGKETINGADMKNLEELLHVFDCHTATALRVIEGEEDEYGRSELLAAIAEARSEIKDFRANWLLPLIEETERLRRSDIAR